MLIPYAQTIRLPHHYYLHLTDELASGVVQSRTALWTTNGAFCVYIAVDTRLVELRCRTRKCGSVLGVRPTMCAVNYVIESHNTFVFRC